MPIIIAFIRPTIKGASEMYMLGNKTQWIEWPLSNGFQNICSLFDIHWWLSHFTMGQMLITQSIIRKKIHTNIRRNGNSCEMAIEFASRESRTRFPIGYRAKGSMTIQIWGFSWDGERLKWGNFCLDFYLDFYSDRNWDINWDLSESDHLMKLSSNVRVYY